MEVGTAAPFAMPLCSHREAARALRIPPSTLWWWLEGRTHEGYDPVLRDEASTRTPSAEPRSCYRSAATSRIQATPVDGGATGATVPPA
jgi:hypothetical protein